MITSQVTAGAGSALLAFATAWALISPPPTVEVRSLLMDTDEFIVTYTRTVNAKTNVRAPVRNEILRADNERPVEECQREDWAFFQVDESRVKNFPIDFFFGHGCALALETGVEYIAVTTVMPIEGNPSQVQSEPFVWRIGN